MSSPDPIQQIRRKPIYDDHNAPSTRNISATTPPPASGITSKPNEEPLSPRKNSPTDRLATHIKESRLYLHSHAARAEDALNNTLSRFLSAEKNFTSTIASLAPPKESNEKLLPGGIYVLVAAMAGSILSRNRNFLLRFATPVVTGVTAAHYVVPVTTRNVGDLVWRFEEEFPVVRDQHLRVREGVRHFVETGKAHSQMGWGMAEEKVGEVRESVLDFVRRGW